MSSSTESRSSGFKPNISNPKRSSDATTSEALFSIFLTGALGAPASGGRVWKSPYYPVKTLSKDALTVYIDFLCAFEIHGFNSIHFQ